MFPFIATPHWDKCEDETCTPKSGNLEFVETPETLKFNCRGQNISHWSVLYTIGKLLKCRCRKWACMSHLNICSMSYGKKKGRESNWQFDSRPLKVGNQPDLGACRCSVTHRWKAFDESYKFDPRSKQRVMSSQSGKNLNRNSFETPPWESRDKKPFGCRCRRETQRIL
jgi:hypothetical protein